MSGASNSPDADIVQLAYDARDQVNRGGPPRRLTTGAGYDRVHLLDHVQRYLITTGADRRSDDDGDILGRARRKLAQASGCRAHHVLNQPLTPRVSCSHAVSRGEQQRHTVGGKDRNPHIRLYGHQSIAPRRLGHRFIKDRDRIAVDLIHPADPAWIDVHLRRQCGA